MRGSAGQWARPPGAPAAPHASPTSRRIDPCPASAPPPPAIDFTPPPPPPLHCSRCRRRRHHCGTADLLLPCAAAAAAPPPRRRPPPSQPTLARHLQHHASTLLRRRTALLPSRLPAQPPAPACAPLSTGAVQRSQAPATPPLRVSTAALATAGLHRRRWQRPSPAPAAPTAAPCHLGWGPCHFSPAATAACIKSHRFMAQRAAAAPLGVLHRSGRQPSSGRGMAGGTGPSSWQCPHGATRWCHSFGCTTTTARASSPWERPGPELPSRQSSLPRQRPHRSSPPGQPLIATSQQWTAGLLPRLWGRCRRRLPPPLPLPPLACCSVCSSIRLGHDTCGRQQTRQ